MVRRLNSSADSSCPEYSVKKLCWKISQSLQENTCAGVSFEQSCKPESFNLIKNKLQHKILFMLASSSRLTGVEGGVKMLLVFDTSVWFTLPPRIPDEAV